MNQPLHFKPSRPPDSLMSISVRYLSHFQHQNQPFFINFHQFSSISSHKTIKMPSIKRAATEESTEGTRKAAKTDAGRPNSSKARLLTPEPTSEAANEPALDAEEPVETTEAVEPAVKMEKKQKKARPTLTTAPTATYDVSAFGANESCQLGITGLQQGLHADAISKGVDLHPLMSPTFNPALSEASVVQVALGSAHGVALTSSNKVLTWGCADFGQLGRKLCEGKDEDEADDAEAAKDELLTPAEVTNNFPADTVITQVAASASASFALTATGDVWGWGSFVVRPSPSINFTSSHASSSTANAYHRTSKASWAFSHPPKSPKPLPKPSTPPSQSAQIHHKHQSTFRASRTSQN